MRAGAVVADPEPSAAWSENPAGLARLAGGGIDVPVLGGWRHAASAALELTGDTDAFALTWGGHELGSDLGLGAGYLDRSGGSVLGAGFGKSWPGQGIAWGVSWSHYSPDSGNSDNVFDAGVLGQWAGLGLGDLGSARWAVVLRDVTGQFQRIWDAGIAFDLGPLTTVTVDLADITGEIDSQLRIGAIRRLTADSEWRVGIGLNDGDLAVGFLRDGGTGWRGGRFSYGLAWQDNEDGDSSLLLGATAEWGL